MEKKQFIERGKWWQEKKQRQAKKGINSKEKKLSYQFIDRGKRNNKFHKTKQHNQRQSKLYSESKTKVMRKQRG